MTWLLSKQHFEPHNFVTLMVKGLAIPPLESLGSCINVFSIKNDSANVGL